MATVTGSIGGQAVQFNDAATDSTLREILAALHGQSGPAAAAKAAQIAATAGINNANTQLQNLANTTTKAQEAGQKLGRGLGYAHTAAESLTESFNRADKALGAFVGQLITGTAQVSDFYASLSKLPGVLGTVAGLFQRIAQFQESNLSAYQQITNAGTNFGGSLTQMRQAALSTYMSFTDFTKVVSNNSEAFSRMGGTVDQGAKAFVKLSNSLLSSEAGDNLRALGYTTEQVNQGMINYINMTGGRTKDELKNTKDITAASVEYLTQLDGLAQITGKTREQQEQALKEANQNAAIQAKMANMDEKQKAAYLKGLAEMEGKFGKAGREMYQAQVLGIPPMTEAAKNLTALAPEVSRASQGMADVANRGGTLSETMRYSAQATEGAVKASERFGNIAGAMSFQGGALSESLMGLQKAANQARQQGRTTEAAELEARAKILEEEKKRKESEAKAAVEAQKAVQEMGQSVMAMLLPAIKLLTPVVNSLVGMFGSLLKTMAEYKTITVGLVVALAAYLASQKVIAAMDAVKAARKQGKGIAGAAGAAIGSVFGGGAGVLGTRGNPIYAIILGGSLGSIPGLGSPGTPGIPGGGPTGGPGSTTRQPPDTREERLRRVQEGRTAQRVGTGLKGAGIVGAVTGLAMLGSELSNIQKQKEENIKQGMDKQKAEAEAKKETAGAVGETGGGALGGWGGALLGAKLGTLIAPGIGTVIGGALGGIAGAVLGAAGGKSGGEALFGGGSKETPKMAAGGLITKPTNVIAGEAGPEAILPLSPDLVAGFSKIASLSKDLTADKTSISEEKFDKSPELSKSNTVYGKSMESLVSELQTLNKQTAEMMKYMKDTSEYSKRNIDAINNLSGDLFKM